jgi:signal recognition particle GTPase
VRGFASGDATKTETQTGHKDVTTTIKAEHNENVVWSDALLSKEERQACLNASHVGASLWITGLSGSGKSTVGAALEHRLLEMGVHAYRLDGDNIRFGLNKGLGFSAADREVRCARERESEPRAESLSPSLLLQAGCGSTQLTCACSLPVACALRLRLQENLRRIGEPVPPPIPMP